MSNDPLIVSPPFKHPASSRRYLQSPVQLHDPTKIRIRGRLRRLRRSIERVTGQTDSARANVALLLGEAGDGAAARSTQPAERHCTPGHGSLSLAVGDVLQVAASGATIEEGAEFVQLVGPLISAVVGLHGAVIEPAAMPGVTFVIARGHGTAKLSFFQAFELREATSKQMDVRILPTG